MQKKIVALLLAVLVCVCAFSACKSDKQGSTKTKNGTTAAAQTDENGSKSTTNTSGKQEGGSADAGESTNSNNSGTASADGKTTTAKTETGKTDGWEQQKNGELVKGEVSVNVAKYDSTSLADGEELIQQLIKGGISGAKVLSNEKTENTVIYTVSGKRIGEKQAEFMKFQFVPKGGTGYLVTVIAASQADLDTDLSYVLANLQELAI